MQTTEEATSGSLPGVKKITFAGWAMCVLFACTWFVWDRTTESNLDTRPILPVLAMYLSAFAIALYALRTLLRSSCPERFVPIVIVFALSFRLIQLFSSPFLEIDIYRYMWDGIVVSNGMSPYEWSPQQVQSRVDVLDAQREIVKLAGSTQSVQQIVSKVHFAEYTTIYPPVSQAVFGVTMWLVPDRVSVRTHLTVMKLALVVFDVGIMFLVLACLRLTGKNPVWVTAYAWNPLVIKEVANSGHLDSIAVFFMMAAVFVTLRELVLAPKFRVPSAVLVGALVSLGTAAKLFPIVLVPFFATWICRRSWRSAVAFILATGIVTACLMSPMLVRDNSQSRNGLTGFLSKWRMNGLPFDIVYENLQSHEESANPWYSIVPSSVRSTLRSVAASFPGTLPPATKIARTVTLSIFAAIYLWVLIRTLRQPEAITSFPRHAFYLLVAFLFLQPTVNPWYWVWVTPLACFTKNHGWHVVGVGLLFYYARFWFKYSGVSFELGGMRYANVDVFDHIVVWGEYALFVTAVVAFHLRGQTKCCRVSE
jgi:hypothetical protein